VVASVKEPPTGVGAVFRVLQADRKLHTTPVVGVLPVREAATKEAKSTFEGGVPAAPRASMYTRATTVGARVEKYLPVSVYTVPPAVVTGVCTKELTVGPAYEVTCEVLEVVDWPRTFTVHCSKRPVPGSMLHTI